TDFGENWSSCNNGIYAAQTLDIIFDKGETLYAACWSNGIYKSTNYGDSWIRINHGLTNVNLLSIVVDTNGVFMAGTDHGIFRSTDNGESWVQVTSIGNDFSFHLYKDRRNRIYTLNYGDGIYRTTNLGVTWERIDDGFGSYFAFGFAIDSSDNIYAGTRNGYIYKSTNDGLSWTSLRNTNNIYNSVIANIVVAPNGYIYATNMEEGVLRSTDNGATWTVMNNGISGLEMSDIKINGRGEIYMSTDDDKFYLSSNNGQSWQNILSNLEKTRVNQIIFDKYNNVYLATDESVWRNADAITPVEIVNLTAQTEGNNVRLEWTTATEVNNYGFTIERKAFNSAQWAEIAFIKGAGSSSKPVTYSYIDNKIPSSKYNYRLKQTDYDGSRKYYYFNKEISITGPATYSLSQNYPNPFNPSTTIRYSIKDAGLVKLEIYDILGRKVATIVNEEKPAGEYEVNFNGNNLASGIYFYKLATGSFTQIRKMQLLK
ncbi:MAG: T9SS type A sorting domain-containing protein, partial [Bacteroidota bacterium]|nr:T9SS type A sorting domain-containing protein [Bacteroidota bacterium]